MAFNKASDKPKDLNDIYYLLNDKTKNVIIIVAKIHLILAYSLVYIRFSCSATLINVVRLVSSFNFEAPT